MKEDLLKAVLRVVDDSIEAKTAIELKKDAKTINIELEGKRLSFEPFVKGIVNSENIGTVLLKLKDGSKKNEILLISRYINPEVAETLKAHQIAFADLAGNMHIKRKGIYLFIKGNKRTDDGQLQSSLAATFSEFKLVFIFLTWPEYLKKSYREMGQATGTALGAVSNTIKSLKSQKLLVDLKEHGLKLVDKQKLIDRWVDIYISKYRNKLLLGTYETELHEWWKDCEIIKYDAKWSGEIAAANIVGIIQPGIATIFTESVDARLIAKYKLKKSPQGKVEALKQFWAIEQKEPQHGKAVDSNNVPILMIYADLLARSNDRCLEAASHIYDHFIKPNLIE